MRILSNYWLNMPLYFSVLSQIVFMKRNAESSVWDVGEKYMSSHSFQWHFIHPTLLSSYSLLSKIWPRSEEWLQSLFSLVLSWTLQPWEELSKVYPVKSVTNLEKLSSFHHIFAINFWQGKYLGHSWYCIFDNLVG